VRAPVGRLDLNNYPAAVAAMNPVQDFIAALTRVRRGGCIPGFEPGQSIPLF